ncbi:MAG TPA: PaaI family thioesterase [Solirubrobacteraceae bacterium]|nr:PaaI family thioesterase [Solirubrobacteraceae bacterium]
MSAPAQEVASASNGGTPQARERTRTFSWHDPAATAAEGLKLSGLDYIRAIATGTLPPPPIAELLGFRILEADEGRAVFAVEPAEWMYNPIGMVHGGVAATLLDSCMGCAVHTSLAPGVGYTTTDLQVRYIRAMGESTGRVLAEGRLVHAGKRTATADGRVFTEADEKLIAHGTTGCVIFA